MPETTPPTMADVYIDVDTLLAAITPGDWSVYTMSRRYGEYRVHNGPDLGATVAETAGGLGATWNVGDPFCIESAANALAISALPHLLRSIKTIRDLVEQFDGGCNPADVLVDIAAAVKPYRD